MENIHLKKLMSNQCINIFNSCKTIEGQKIFPPLSLFYLKIMIKSAKGYILVIFFMLVKGPKKRAISPITPAILQFPQFALGSK